MLKVEFQAMGCQMLLAAENSSPQAEIRLREVPDLFANWEQTLSRFRGDSELTHLNNHAGEKTRVSQVMWDVMQAANKTWKESEGLITPAILPNLESAGYTKSFELIDQRDVDLKNMPKEYGVKYFNSIEFDQAQRSILLPVGMRVELGGIAKGWAANEAMTHLRDLGPVLVDSGGDIAISSPLSDGTPWSIGVNDPINRGEQIEQVLVLEGGVATSGRDHRRWKQGKHWRHHIIDPRTGLPAETDLLSVTVISDDVLRAEMAAKKVLILGSEEGLAWLDEFDHSAGLAVTENGELLGSHGIEDYLRK